MATIEPTDQLALDLVAVAREAGKAILEIYATDFDVRAKDDKSPVTLADETSEGVIIEHLEKLTPDVPIIAEEAYSAGHRPDVSGGTFWLVDALDGTKEFISRNGEFTVNIALIVNGKPVLGVVHAPVLNTTYWGNPNGAHLQQDDDAPEDIAARTAPEDGLTVMTSRSHRSSEGDFLDKYDIKDEISAGSSIKFCLVAAGKADLYPRLGRTMEWDTAAGHAVLASAGGKVSTLDGTPLTYGKPDFGNPEFVATGRSA